MTRQRDAVKLWKVLQEQALEDDVNEILAMSDAELDQHIKANGGDPAAIRASGAALARELSERREQLAWQGEMHDELRAFQERAAASKTKVPLPRPELLKRLDAARRDPRFTAPVAALFRKKSAEDATDEELQLIVDQIELLAQEGSR
ncbi:MAG TPA: hypothetical protein VGI39_30540 [Polyangiaceae bacterium]|jgi:hypothetical protein